jgi:hypothetical protein
MITVLSIAMLGILLAARCSVGCSQHDRGREVVISELFHYSLDFSVGWVPLLGHVACHLRHVTLVKGVVQLARRVT